MGYLYPLVHPLLILIMVLGMQVKRDYEAYLENIDYMKVVEGLTIGGPKWVITNRRHKSFDAKNLTNISYVWKYFICLKLMPTMHYNTFEK